MSVRRRDLVLALACAWSMGTCAEADTPVSGAPATAAPAVAVGATVPANPDPVSAAPPSPKQTAPAKQQAVSATAPAGSIARKRKKKTDDDDDGEWILLPEAPKAVTLDNGSTAPAQPLAAVDDPRGATVPTPAVVPQAVAATAVVPPTVTPLAGAPQPAAAAPINPVFQDPQAAQSPPVQPSPTQTAAAQTAAAQPATVDGAQRLALVIGNSNYKLGRLPNSVNDAQAIANTLKQLGWKVIELENANRDEMVQAAAEFGSRLSAGGEGLFYYAGHGVQSGNVNYLIPIDADIQDADELPAHAYDANDILKKMESAKSLLNIVILDACRNNPFASRFSSAEKGLAGMQPLGNPPMLISYATMPGATAADGLSGNGLYTSELLKAMSVSGQKIEDVFKQVRAEVKRRSGGKQIPYEGSTLDGDLYFNPTPEQAALLPRMASAEGPDTGQSRSIAPLLVSRTLFDNYQLSANLVLAANLSIGKFSLDSTSFITATQDQKLRIWNTATGTATFSQPDFGRPILSENDRFIIGLPDARTVHLLDTEASKFSVMTYQVTADVQTAAVSPDGKRLLLYLKDRGFQMYATDNASVVGESRKVEGDPHFAFAPGGNRALLWGSTSADLFLWDTDAGRRIGRTSAHHKPIALARFSKDGSRILTAAAGDLVEIWQASDGAELNKLTLGDGNPVPTQAEFLDGGTRVIINTLKSARDPDAGYILGVWDVGTGKPPYRRLANTKVKAMTFSPDQERLFVTASDSSTHVFDLSTNAEVDALSGAELIGFSRDGRRLIAHDENGVRLYDAHSLTPVARMPAQITAFIGPQGSNLYATVDANGGFRLLHFETGDAASVISKAHIDPISMVSFAPDGKKLATFSDDKVAKLWTLPTVQNIDKLRKDSFESTSEYQHRVADWSSDYTALVTLDEYNADIGSYSVKIGSEEIKVPMGRDDARNLAGQREAYLNGRLKFYDKDSLQLADFKLTRVP